MDIGGSAGGWCWLRPGIPHRAKRFGAIVAITSAAASLVGNAAGHLLAAGYLTTGPVLIMIVGAIPAMVLVALAHLAALLGEPISIEDEEQPEPGAPPSDQSPEAESASDGEQDTRTLVLELIAEHPRTVGELAHLTGKARSTVTGHLAALAKNDAVVRDRDKRYLARPRPSALPADETIRDEGEPGYAE
ncbi:winged helix-turn-helix domain-containing protein [Kineosporia sp. NBRC 101677]|uniref:ArsR/SmtB family transcription factor n=1 Tax=Kineosporia sp. NBRC 101677 TaxID=3032197 RepID=UPI0025528763|nr:winged helix-turn-helix domain-containing protein [Kineosporia sp. NBRC 101677]